jgi:exodeoxyribonuclease-3
MLKVMTYNVEFGGIGREEQILTVLRDAKADVIGLTEADDRDTVAAWAHALGMNFAWERGIGARHLAVLSRFSIISSAIHKTPPLFQGALETRIQMAETVLTVYTLHLRPYPMWFYEVRRWQAVGALLALIQNSNIGPHLIVGDMNTIAPGERYMHQYAGVSIRRWLLLQGNRVWPLAIARLLRAGYVDCYREMHPNGDGFTYQLDGNWMGRFDFLFASADLNKRLRACNIYTEFPAQTASDHLPVWATFAL